MNGVSIGFTRDAAKQGFDSDNGILRVYLGPTFVSGMDTELLEIVDSAIAANWEAIRAFTGATGDAVKTATGSAATAAQAITDAGTAATAGAGIFAGTTGISKTTDALLTADLFGTRGVSITDPALIIKALEAGTDMAGIAIHFVNDKESGLTEYTQVPALAFAAGNQIPDIKVDFITKEDGSRELIITANVDMTAAGAQGVVNAHALALALNANETFSNHFKADAAQLGAAAATGLGTNIGSISFNTDVTKPSATTVGGYRIESTPTGSGKAATSSGIGMYGQSDSNERLVIESEALGSDQFININVIKGYLNTQDEFGAAVGFASGHDITATINGIRAVAQGNNISVDSPDLSVSMNVANVPGSSGFTITGGGAIFQLGPDVVSQQQMRIGIASMLTSKLGGADGQLFMLKKGNVASLESSDNGRKLADRIVSQAIENVATLRGRLGAIQKGSLEPTVSSLQDSMIALTETVAMITNADFAVESSNLTRLQLLIQAGAQTLGIANQLPQYAAALIR
jgi:flagellin